MLYRHIQVYYRHDTRTHHERVPALATLDRCARVPKRAFRDTGAGAFYPPWQPDGPDRFDMGRSVGETARPARAENTFADPRCNDRLAR